MLLALRDVIPCYCAITHLGMCQEDQGGNDDTSHLMLCNLLGYSMISGPSSTLIGVGFRLHERTDDSYVSELSVIQPSLVIGHFREV